MDYHQQLRHLLLVGAAVTEMRTAWFEAATLDWPSVTKVARFLFGMEEFNGVFFKWFRGRGV
jgi:hypothetical protein